MNCWGWKIASYITLMTYWASSLLSALVKCLPRSWQVLIPLLVNIAVLEIFSALIQTLSLFLSLCHTHTHTHTHSHTHTLILHKCWALQSYSRRWDVSSFQCYPQEILRLWHKLKKKKKSNHCMTNWPWGSYAGRCEAQQLKVAWKNKNV